jgi:adenine deaminase
MDKDLISVALGKKPADIVIRGGLLINVHSGEIYPADVAVFHQTIASVGFLPEGCIGAQTKVIDASGLYLAPGFIDAHIHFESSMLSYTEFAKMAVIHGTCSVASDLMEVTLVSGVEGMKHILEEAKQTPVSLYYPVPAFMGDDDVQTSGSSLSLDMMQDLVKLPEAVGLAEVLFPPILAGSDKSKWMLDLAQENHLVAEGHAPGLSGAALQAYAGCHINSDHESSTAEEALGKLRAGMNVLMREGSAAQDLKACLSMIVKDKISTRHCSMVSDDIDALHMEEKGHLDHKVRMAIKEGVDPISAIEMVTINPAENFRLQDTIGSIAPGKRADIAFLSSLEDCKVEKVMSKGKLVVDKGKLAVAFPPYHYDRCLLDTVTIPAGLRAQDLLIPCNANQAKVHVIGVSGTTLLTEAREAVVRTEDGYLASDVSRDLLHIATVERYGKGGGVGRSYVQGFGLKKGAIGLSVGHDHHNITVVGADSRDMLVAVEEIGRLSGGFVLVEDRKVMASIALPICGLLSDKDGHEVAAELKEMVSLLHSWGCTMESPNVTLSFLTLIYIPAFGITDKGLYEFASQKIISPIIETL